MTRASGCVVALLAACSSSPAPVAAPDATVADVAVTDVAVTDATPVDVTAVDVPPRVLSAARIEGGPVAYVGVERCFTAAHDGPDSARVRGVVEPDVTPVDGGARRCVTWGSIGSYRLFATVTDGPRTVDATLAVTVVPQPAAVRPTASSTIAYDRVRRELWVVNPDSDTVAVFREDPPERLAEVEVCDRPRTVAVDGDTVAVACQDGDALDLIDAASRSRRQRVALPAGSRPFGVAALPRGGRFAVTLQDRGAVALVDRSGSALSTVEVGDDPRHLALNADGDALVARWRGSDDGGRVRRVDLSAARPVETLVLRRQEGLDSDTDNSGVPGFLGAFAFAPHGRSALVPALKANVVTGMFRTGRALRDETTARAIAVEVNLDGPAGAMEESWRQVFDDLDMASAVAWSPEGERVYVAMLGAEVVIALDPTSFNVAGSIRDVGGAPEGLWVSPDGARLWAQGFTSRAVRVFDIRDLSRPPPRLADLSTTARETLTAQQLRGLQVFYASRDPRMSRTSYLSCASCHLDGEGDNLTWDFTQRGEGLRNTIALDGRGGTAQGPLHWSANFDELQDFEHDIRGAQGGAGFIADADLHAGTRDAPLGDPKAGLSAELDAMAAWVATLTRVGVSPHRRDDDPAWRRRFDEGRSVFQRAGCGECHSGSAFTDSGFVEGRTPRLHDVGTLGEASGQRLGGALPGLDTPSLRGLWRSSPYLHDGSAATLRAVLTTRNAGDRHGRTSGLTEAELTALETYLSALDDRTP